MIPARLMAIGLLGLGAFGCRKMAAADDPASNPAARVEGGTLILPADSVMLRTLSTSIAQPASPDSLRLSGRLVWNEDVTVRMFSPFAGRVVRVLADAGQMVAPGDTLALIAAPDFGQAQADLHRAATDLMLAERTLARVGDLFDHGVVAEKDVDAARADAARARAEAQRAASRVGLYGGDTTVVSQIFPLRSPLGGMVVERNITPGQEVRPDQMLANAPQLFAPLFVVTEPSHLWVQLDLPERDAQAVRPGSAIAIHSQVFGDRTFRGKSVLVASAVDPTTRTVKVRAVVDNPDRTLKAEMLVTVVVPGPSSAGLAVPVAAVLLVGGTHVVFVDQGGGRFRRTEVSVGGQRDGMVPVSTGLSAGDRVVTSGSLLLEQLYRQNAHS